jgi:hypothetical protein
MPVWGVSFSESDGDGESGDAAARRRIAAIADFVEQMQN